jgi:hypothetical protein
MNWIITAIINAVTGFINLASTDKKAQADKEVADSNNWSTLFGANMDLEGKRIQADAIRQQADLQKDFVTNQAEATTTTAENERRQKQIDSVVGVKKGLADLNNQTNEADQEKRNIIKWGLILSGLIVGIGVLVLVAKKVTR